MQHESHTRIYSDTEMAAVCHAAVGGVALDHRLATVSKRASAWTCPTFGIHAYRSPTVDPVVRHGRLRDRPHVFRAGAYHGDRSRLQAIWHTK